VKERPLVAAIAPQISSISLREWLISSHSRGFLAGSGAPKASACFGQ